MEACFSFITVIENGLFKFFSRHPCITTCLAPKIGSSFDDQPRAYWPACNLGSSCDILEKRFPAVLQDLGKLTYELEILKFILAYYMEGLAQ